MKILGAGHAGLIASNFFRRFNPTILEASAELPHNHDAVLRFRKTGVSRVTGIPFTEVEVDKGIILDGEFVNPSLRVSNMYSEKVTGKVLKRSINSQESETRYIAPANFTELMSQSCNVKLGRKVTDIVSLTNDLTKGEPIISTLPMPVLMKIVGWEDQPRFEFSPIWSITATVNDISIGVYQTVYYPGPETPAYRVTLEGQKLIVEVNEDPSDTPSDELKVFLNGVLEDFLGQQTEGTLVDIKVKKQPLGKIAPINDRIRKQFIMEMTDRYNIYSLGRFATWKQILLDQVVTDCEMIERFIESGDYDRKKYARS